MKEIVLPEMIVEKRNSTRNWGIPAPDKSKENLNKELQLAIQLNQDVWKSDWEPTTLDILSTYATESVDPDEIPLIVKEVLGFDSWKELVEFVQDDMCTEFFNKTLTYCLNEGQAHELEKGFIDGSGVGYIKAYLKDLKVSLEKAFDVKYFYKLQRPIEWALEQGIDLTKVANKIHPGHFSYVMGHSTKFYQAVKTQTKVFRLDKNCKRNLWIAADVAGLARCGSLIHYPMDGAPGKKLVV